MDYKDINCNLAVLSAYKDDQLKEWLKDNGRDEKELGDLKATIKAAKEPEKKD
jgi:hypothetical protein